jgi:hypothetical protein
LALAAAGPALAIDPGVASGRFAHEGVTLNPKHAVALAMDNVEGVLDHPHVLRVLLSEAEVPPSALYGLAFPPVRAMARDGQVRGLLLEFDPAERDEVQITILAKPSEPGEMPANLSRSDSSGLWTRLDVSATRATGELKGDDESGPISFSAPVFTDAVTADLKGPAAQASEPVKVLIARAEAIQKGDMATAASLSTGDFMEKLKGAPPEMLKMAKAELPQMVKQLRSARRVVIRTETAAVFTGDGSWMSLVKRDGAWKAAD